MSNTTAPPGGLHERTPDWHFQQFVTFTRYKLEVGEPSPHLAMVGYMGRNAPLMDRVWMIGCYAAVYCLPTAQILWTYWPWDRVQSGGTDEMLPWLQENWKGIVTRQERRCVRTAPKLHRCLAGYAKWAQQDFLGLRAMATEKTGHEYYDAVWESVNSIPFIGRYIGIRLIEGLRRFCEVPASLYDVRSVGGWSPKKALVYLYPQHAELLLTESKEGNALTDQLVAELLRRTQQHIPEVDYYVLAAMLCEYREAFEDKHQYPGWTIDQEPLLYDKVRTYWGQYLDQQEFWGARDALFPSEVLGEKSNNTWYGTRWPLTKTLREHGYVWSDLDYRFDETMEHDRWASPVLRDAAVPA